MQKLAVFHLITKHSLNIYFLCIFFLNYYYLMSLRIQFANSCFFFQFCNHLFSVDSRIEERKLRFEAETLHGTKRKGGESLWSGSANLVAISRSRKRLDRCRVEKYYGIFHRGPTRKQ